MIDEEDLDYIGEDEPNSQLAKHLMKTSRSKGNEKLLSIVLKNRGYEVKETFCGDQLRGATEGVLYDFYKVPLLNGGFSYVITIGTQKISVKGDAVVRQLSHLNFSVLPVVVNLGYVRINGQKTATLIYPDV